MHYSISCIYNDLMEQINPAELQQIKDDVSQLTRDFIQLTNIIGHEELGNTATDLLQHINDPYLFVIVGEVKAGKSSFINALLETEKDICKVAPSPMTDTIQQILYGAHESEIIINNYLKKLYYPLDILKEICIVDTPGTNTIIEHHQEITERFVPAADLIVFVFEAKNPYRESAWQFFDYINSEWWKKVIFVLQQKDLLDDADLQINKKEVEEYARKKGLTDPQVFCVSAKIEQSESKTKSGFPDLRKYIDTHILNGKTPVLKQQNNLSTLLNMSGKVKGGLILRRDQYDADVAFRDDIKDTLTQQETKSAKQVDFLVENLIAEYENVTRPKIGEIRDGLGFFSMVGRSFGSTFGMKSSPRDWLKNLFEDLEKDLNTRLKNKLNDGVIDIADSIQQMGKLVDLKLRNSRTILRDDHEIFSDIAERRANVLKELQYSFSSFLNDSKNFYDHDLTRSSDSISPNLAAAGGITAVGVILATITNGMIFDITGGVLTTAGLLFAGVSIGFKRRKIMKEFKEEIDRGREKFNSKVSENLKQYITKIKERIDRNFSRFDRHLEKEGTDIIRFEKEIETLDQHIDALNARLSS